MQYLCLLSSLWHSVPFKQTNKKIFKEKKSEKEEWCEAWLEVSSVWVFLGGTIPGGQAEGVQSQEKRRKERGHWGQVRKSFQKGCQATLKYSWVMFTEAWTLTTGLAMNGLLVVLTGNGMESASKCLPQLPQAIEDLHPNLTPQQSSPSLTETSCSEPGVLFPSRCGCRTAASASVSAETG